ncbi:50S ribosomal protein L15 [Candidatus Kaiserbacteria bacterium CG10_big_fil_rev_8_21_14_0_10_49_17]|uniref:Large ribosomal subunit protein uL15 n=1 Tax=Candidatus Kaiserbacteria bacterium CG10_big_fil_rev_8_21_14_0_10_49_17 TaxID=1974609 RepID=A0A2M6WEH9_9BACT|nr:MAG: 50S ribosomal protein L15 [Candidatus Kaiserbacteria bacterium CG10_big_fil_rev_8_21_14_0_10_49_17]
MQLHELQRHTKNKDKKRVGRGGTRGKTSGRGTKGQKARAGHSLRPEMRDTIKKLPKLRGRGKNINKRFHKRAVPVNLSLLEAAFSAGESVTPETLVEKKIIKKSGGVYPVVKILGVGTLSKKLSVAGVDASAKAKEAIESAGGSMS